MSGLRVCIKGYRGVQERPHLAVGGWCRHISNSPQPVQPGAAIDQVLRGTEDATGGYFKPKVNVVAQHFRFHKRLQGPGELVNTYMSALWQMVSACKFGKFLDDTLHDQLVCRLACDKVQGWCLAATNLKLEKAFELASMMDGAQEGLMWLRPTSAAPSSSTSEPTVAQDLPEACYQTQVDNSSAQTAKSKRHAR